MSTGTRTFNNNRESNMSLLKVLSFNIWGLHWLGSVRIRERLSYIVQELKKYDIVGLQEVWKSDDYKYLIEQLKDDLPHHSYLHSGIIGSGLCIFSRYPIMESHSHVFTVCGSMWHLLDGELFSGKGVLLCRVLTPSGIVNVYNTHLDPRNRDSESFEIQSFVHQSRGADPVILLGDFNTKPSHDAHNFLVTSLGLQDVFADAPQDTCDLKSNIYTLRHLTPKRIDYVLFSNSRSPSLNLAVQSRCLAVTGLIPGKAFPYSDHEGVEACFRVEKNKVSESNGEGDWPQPQDKTNVIEVFQQMEKTLRSKQPMKKSIAAALASYMAIASLVLLLSFIMSSLAYPRLAPYGLGWTSYLCVAAAAALGMWFVIYTMVKGGIRMALESNLAEINTTLNYLQATSEIKHF